jgi:hypothetical protein
LSQTICGPKRFTDESGFTQSRAAANPAGASRLQSLRPVRRVAELGSLGVMSTRKRLLYSFLTALIFEAAMVGLGVLCYHIDFVPMVIVLDWIHRPVDVLLSSLALANLLWPRVILMILFWTLAFFIIASWKYWKYERKDT